MLAWLAAGCVSLTPAPQRGADDVRAMADEMARVYDVPRIAVIVGDNIEGVGLDHDRPLTGTLSLDWQREQELRELDANAKSVEILARIRRLSEAEALGVVHEHLLAFNRLVVARPQRSARRGEAVPRLDNTTGS
jgi:hypothetical protein